MFAMISQLWPIRLYGSLGCCLRRKSARAMIFQGSSAAGWCPVNQLSYPWRTVSAVPLCSKSRSETVSMAVPLLFSSVTPLPNWMTRPSLT
jgi:hypothetical protein